MNAECNIPTLDDLQAGANARVRSEIARQLGELTMRCTDAEAVGSMWQRQADNLQAALNRAIEDLQAGDEREHAVRDELEAARCDLTSAQHTAAHLSEGREACAAELNEIDAILARRSALDGLDTRTDKIRYLLKVAESTGDQGYRASRRKGR